MFSSEAKRVGAIDFVVLQRKYYKPTPFVQNEFLNCSDVVDYTVTTLIYYLLGLICHLPLHILNHIIHIFNPNESVLLNHATY